MAPQMTQMTDFHHIVTYRTEGEPDMQRGRWFVTRSEGEAHAALLVETLGGLTQVMVCTTSECQRLGI